MFIVHPLYVLKKSKYYSSMLPLLLTDFIVCKSFIYVLWIQKMESASTQMNAKYAWLFSSFVKQ